jgi:hypothetical protein
MPLSKKSAACELRHVLTPFINSSLLLKHCDRKVVLQVGKQVIVTWSEIRAVRRVVPVEMLQQCLSVTSCMWTCFVREEHYIGCQHSMPFVLNGQLYAVLCFALHFLHCCGPLLHEFHHYQLFWLVWLMCMHPLLWLFFGFSIYKWNPGFITCYLYDVIEKFITIFVGLL